MLPIPPEYAGALCEIKTLGNDFLTVCHIIKIDHEALEFAAGEGERMPLIQYREPVKVIVHSSKLRDQILVGSAYLSTNNFLRLEDVRELAEFERRGAFRVNTGVEGKLYPILSESQQREFDQRIAQAGSAEAEQILSEAYMAVQVMDISLTGARLKTPRPLRVGDKYYLEFILLNDTKNYGLQVERIITMANGDQHYGCIFFDMTSYAVDALCRDLFQLQRIEKNRRSNAIL